MALELDWSCVATGQREGTSWKLCVWMHVSQDGSWMGHVALEKGRDITGLTPTVPKGRQRTARGMGFFACRDDEVLVALDLR